MISPRAHVFVCKGRPAATCRPALTRGVLLVRRPVVVMRVHTGGDDSEAMAQDNWANGQPPQEVLFTEQDIKEGNQEGSSPHEQPVTGTEYGQATEQRSSSSEQGASGATSQKVSEAPGDQPEGRFDEEPQLGDHPYDPRPRERGHGVPPHKDASNTGPAAGA